MKRYFKIFWNRLSQSLRKRKYSRIKGLNPAKNVIWGRNIVLEMKGGALVIGNNTSVYDAVEITCEGSKSSITIGSDNQIKKESRISCKNGGQTEFGNHVALGRRAEIVCEKARVQVGNYVRVAAEVFIITNNHSYNKIDVPIHLHERTHKDVIIEDDVWLGRRVMIMPGVTIGRGSVIAAGAVVTKDIPEFSIAGGIPAKVIGNRNG